MYWACLLLGEAEIADLDCRAVWVAQIRKQVVALQVKVHHMPAVQVLHACTHARLGPPQFIACMYHALR